MRSVAVLTHLGADTAWGLWDRWDATKTHDDEWWDESDTHIGYRDEQARVRWMTNRRQR